MSVKRSRCDEINECNNYMKRLKVTNKLLPSIENVIYKPDKQIINKIKESENELNNKINLIEKSVSSRLDNLDSNINLIEKSVSSRLDNLDSKIHNINTKLDRLINLVSNSLFDKPSYNYQSDYIS